jgi:hypothetical protein
LAPAVLKVVPALATPDILRRQSLAAPADVMGWVTSGLDLLAIEATFLATAEFATNG